MGRLEEKILEYRQVMDTGPEGLDERYQGILYGLELARDITSGELDRLSALETKLMERIKKASDEITELNEDWEAASEADCDFEVFERIQREMGRAQAQLKVLSSLLSTHKGEAIDG